MLMLSLVAWNSGVYQEAFQPIPVDPGFGEYLIFFMVTFIIVVIYTVRYRLSTRKNRPNIRHISTDTGEAVGTTDKST